MEIPHLPEEYDQLDQWKTLMLLYNAALQEVQARVNVLNDEFHHINDYNPIELVKAWIKSPVSIVKKLTRLGCEAILQVFVSSVRLRRIFIILQKRLPGRTTCRWRW